VKAKHTLTQTLDVLGWRPSAHLRTAELVVGEGAEPIGTAALTTPLNQREALAQLFARYCRHHPTRIAKIPEGCRYPDAGSWTQLSALHNSSVSVPAQVDVAIRHALAARLFDLRPPAGTVPRPATRTRRGQHCRRGPQKAPGGVLGHAGQMLRPV